MGCGNSKPTPIVDGAKKLQDAADIGDYTQIQLLLDGGVSPNTPSPSKWTPLHTAGGRGDTKVAQLLLDRGAELQAKDSFASATPLHCAAEDGQYGCTKLFLERGADIHCRDFLQETPLHRAAKGTL